MLVYAVLLANRTVAASKVLHHRMLSAVLRAPLTFFETTPAGRILNRFSRDIETVDTLLPELVESWLVSAFDVLATLGILLYSTPVFLAVALPLAVLYYFAQVTDIRVLVICDSSSSSRDHSCGVVTVMLPAATARVHPIHVINIAGVRQPPTFGSSWKPVHEFFICNMNTR